MEDERKRRKFRKILLIAVLLAAAAVHGTALRSSEQDISVSRRRFSGGNLDRAAKKEKRQKEE